ncbi:MAG: hypothetical protein QOG78_3708 [Rhodospirillaceae bacterium]|jgi:hypothetical protein|nr:hypothetical protein [Rhodospirillaceae bacterium]MEA2806894.1 hypothetical protein [Rhodospirillaceae bacterium]MEA2848427.1 hypothetical protein [Rhodospirillaceae bacterium]
MQHLSCVHEQPDPRRHRDNLEEMDDTATTLYIRENEHGSHDDFAREQHGGQELSA